MFGLTQLFGKPDVMSQPHTVEKRTDLCKLIPIKEGWFNPDNLPEINKLMLNVDCRDNKPMKQISLGSKVLYTANDEGKYEQIGIFNRAIKNDEYSDNGFGGRTADEYNFFFYKNDGSDKRIEEKYNGEYIRSLINKSLYIYKPSEQNGGGKKKRTRTRRPKKSNRRRTNRK